MSKVVAIAGGSGNIAQEVIDAILDRGVYQIVILSRKDTASDGDRKNVAWKKSRLYQSCLAGGSSHGHRHASLIYCTARSGSCREICTHSSYTQQSKQVFGGLLPRNGASGSDSGIAHYAYKDSTRKILEEINAEKRNHRVLTLPTRFFSQTTSPPRTALQNTSGHLKMFADFENRRAIVLEGSEAAPLTLTTVEDTAKVVALALEYKGKWPRKGGIQGSQTTVGQFLALAEKIRGPFQVERLRLEDVVRGELKTSWVPLVEHEAVPVEQREAGSRYVLGEYLRSIASGAWSVGDEWNQALPEYTFTGAEEYLQGVWKGKA